MDVVRPLIVLLLLSSFACAPMKSLSQVMEGEDGDNPSNKPCASQNIKNQFVVEWEDGHIETYSAESYESFKRNFVEPQLNLIKRVEFNKVIALSTPVTPSPEALFSDSDWGQKIIRADEAWAQNIKGQNIVIGVVDTWVDYGHEQLADRFKVNTGEIPNNGVDDDGNGFVDDYYGYDFSTGSTGPQGEVADHGTHVSGIMVANAAKGSVKGVAPEARIISAPFLSYDGYGDMDRAIKAFDYLRSRNVNVINASWGGRVCSLILKNKIEDLGRSGILVVVAAGNDGLDVGVVDHSPASFNASNQLTIAASSYYDFLTSWSNFSRQVVHLAAPGERIFSTIPKKVDPKGAAYLDGTSMATPFVTAAAALLMSASPTASVAAVKAALMNSVDQPHDMSVISHGRLNIPRAVQALRGSNP